MKVLASWSNQTATLTQNFYNNANHLQCVRNIMVICIMFKSGSKIHIHDRRILPVSCIFDPEEERNELLSPGNITYSLISKQIRQIY
jgi:hypothetical protein